MTEKAIIFDSGTLISFSMNGLTDEIRKLKSIFKGKFLITNDVKKEIIDKPLTIKRFELEGLKLKQLLSEGVLEMPSSLGIKDNEIAKKSDKILGMANSIFVGKDGKDIHIIDTGETSCLALSNILTEKKIKNVIALDERTTRMLVENPESLRNYLEKKLHVRITAEKKDFEFCKQFKIIRSTELIYVAYKKGLINIKGEKVLDALLYAMKFKGAAISEDEIREIKKLG